ncbi:hypothetical protein BN9982_60042 [Mycobacterium tuberculosis]|nr:hypothetical protein BN9982_60042 [Mycobacterium tuberculosis]
MPPRPTAPAAPSRRALRLTSEQRAQPDTDARGMQMSASETLRPGWPKLRTSGVITIPAETLDP